METEFGSDDLRVLDADSSTEGNYLPGVVKGFRKRMQIIRAANDIRDLYAMKGNKFEKLSGNRKGQYSLVLNKNWRLVVELIETAGNHKVKIIEIVDYH